MYYTLQWLVQPSHSAPANAPDNDDATFKANTDIPKPSDVLLHYSCGAAAVKQWGHIVLPTGADKLTSQAVFELSWSRDLAWLYGGSEQLSHSVFPKMVTI